MLIVVTKVDDDDVSAASSAEASTEPQAAETPVSVAPVSVPAEAPVPKPASKPTLEGPTKESLIAVCDCHAFCL